MGRYLSCSCPAFSEVELWPIELLGAEGYSSPGEFELLTLASAQALDLASWIGKQIEWQISPQGQAARDFFGYIVKMEAIETDLHGFGLYQITASSWSQLLVHTKHSRTFYKKKLPDILQTILAPYGASFGSGQLVKKPVYPTGLTPEIGYQEQPFILPDDAILPDYIVQYNESDLNFITRLLDSLGVYYWIDWNCKENALYLGGGKNEDYNRVVDSLIISDNAPHSDSNVLLDFNVKHNITSNKVAQAAYNPEQAAATPVNKSIVKNSVDIKQSPAAEEYHYPAAEQVRSQAEKQQQRQIELELHSVVVNIGLGQILRIEGNVPTELQQNPSILPIAITHFAKDYDGLPHADYNGNYHILPSEWPLLRTHYENKVTAVVNNDVPYHPKIKAVKPAMPGYQTAFIVGPKNDFYVKTKEGDIYTDKLGRVKIWFPWDENNPNEDPSLCPWVRVRQAQAGKKYGHQFIPYVGDEVNVMFGLGSCDKPIVTGSNYNALTKPPFDVSKNNTVSGIKTSKHAMFFLDEKDQEHVVLYSKGDLEQQVGGDHTRTINGMDHLLVGGDALEEVMNGHYNISANKSIKLQSGASCVTITGDKIDVSGPKIQFTTKGGGDAGELAVKGSYHKCGKIGHKGGPILQGSSDVTIGGKPAARVGDKAHCRLSTDQLKQGHDNLYINGKLAVCVNHKTKHGGKVKEGVSNTSAGYDPNLIPKTALQSERYAIKLLFQMNAYPEIKVLFHQFGLAKNDDEKFSKSYVINSKDGESIAEGIAGGKIDCYLQPYPRQLDIVAVNGNYQIPYYKTSLDAPTNPVNNDNFDSDHTFVCDVLWPLVVHDIRQEDRNINSEKPSTNKSEDEIEQVKSYFKTSTQDYDYFVKNGNNVTVFIHGYNVPLGEFTKEISGFENVLQEKLEEAKFSGTMGSIAAANDANKEAPGMGLKANTVGYYSTIYRDAKILEGQTKFSLPAKYVQKSDDGLQYITVADSDVSGGKLFLNGTGARNWAINMENNLNKVASSSVYTSPEYYKKYTRLLHVTWTGNPSSPLDYMQAAGEDAFDPIAVGELKQLFLDLKAKGLTVNVVAHSLGNAILIAALNELGKEGKSVDHVFMWEAAVPNDVFARPKPKKGRKDPWYLPNLVDGADKFTVLYSNNDNILGEIPESDSNGVQINSGVKQIDINKSKPLTELVPAYLTTKLGLTSIYHFAMWAGCPLSAMWNLEKLQELYQSWLAHGIDAKYLAPSNLSYEQKLKQVDQSTKCLLPTLAEQVKFDKLANGELYEDLLHKLQTYMPEMRDTFKAAGWGVKSKFQQFEYDLGADIGTSVIENPTMWRDIALAVVGVAEGAVSSLPGGGVAVQKANSWALDKGAELYAQNKPILDAIFCMIRVMQKSKANPVSALGYAGASQSCLKNPQFVSKYIGFEQTKWLWSHSAMHVPNEAVQQIIYKGVIMNKQSGIKKFGLY